MKGFLVQSPLGRLEMLAESKTAIEPAVALCLEHAQAASRFAGPVLFQGHDAWLKADVLSGRARLRHAALRLTLNTPPPRVREAFNLAWLDARLFQVPLPLAAGWFGGAIPSWQFLVMQRVDARPLGEVLRAGGKLERTALLLELARETARMHALHFVHRDLFWRNVLVYPEPTSRRLVFIDAWRGGEWLQWRGAGYDLACLFLEGPSFLSKDEIRSWLANYIEERQALDKPASERSLWLSANAARRSLLARTLREPGRWRASEPLVQEFDFAAAR